MTFSPIAATIDPTTALKRAAALSERLQSSDTFRECEDVVRIVTGLKLSLESADRGDVPPFFGVTSFYNVLERHEQLLATARANISQIRVPSSQIGDLHEANIGGLREAAVSLRIGTERIGVLRIGQALTSNATSDVVAEISQTWFGNQPLPDEVRLAIMQLPVITPERWNAAVWLLKRVAGFLSTEGLRVVALSGGMEPEPVARAREYINLHFLEEELSLPQIADTVGVTPNYLSHVYRKHTSLSVTESINRLRVEHAQDLLSQGGRRISEVARASGFGSLSQFNRSFRRYIGNSPTIYKGRGMRA